MQTPTTSSKASSSSVPLSVYRELAVEWQAAQTTINTLTVQNQQLAHENQLLKQEMKKAVESVLHLQNLIDSFPQAIHNPAPRSIPRPSQPTRTINQPRPSRQFHPPSPVIAEEMEIFTDEPETVFIEEQEVSYYHSNEPSSSDVSGMRLMISLLLIILLGFGAGYLIVRPFFEQHNR